MISNGPDQYDNTLQIRLLGGDSPDIYATGADKLIMQAKNGYVLCSIPGNGAFHTSYKFKRKNKIRKERICMKRKSRVGIFVSNMVFLSMLLVLLVSPASAATINVNVNLNNNTPVWNNIIGVGGEIDPFMFMSHETIWGIGDDDFSILNTRIKKSGISFTRMWAQPDWWEPVNDNSDPNIMNDAGFTWNNNEMQSMYKYLDALKALNVTVELNNFHSDYKKLYPWMMWTQDTLSAPASDKISEFAECMVALVKHLVVTKGYTNVKYLALYSEPESGLFIPPTGYDPLTYHKSIVQAVYNRLVSEGLSSQVKIVAPEVVMPTTNGEAWYSDYTANMGSYVGGYTIHAFTGSQELQDGTFASKLSTYINQKNINDPSGSTKPLMFTENANIPIRGTFEAGLSFASIVAHGLSKGVAAFSQWRLYDDIYPPPIRVNQTMTAEGDSGWGWWGHKQEDWTPKFKYYINTLLSKYVQPGSTSYSTSSSDNRVNAAIVKNSSGKYTIIIVNWSTDTVSASYTLQQSINTTFKKYKFQETVMLDSNVSLSASIGTLAVNGTTFTDSIPPRTVYVYTDIPDSTAPAQVTGLNAYSSSYDKVTLLWTANTDADLCYYRIYRDTVSGFTPSSVNQIGELWVKSGDTPTFNDNNVEPGITYYYKVSAVDTSENEGIASAQAQVTTAQVSYAGTLTVTDDTVNKYYEIYSNNDNGYRIRVSKLSGMIRFLQDTAGVARNSFTNDTYSIPRVLKYSSTAYTEKVLNGGAESGSGTPANWSNWTDDTAGSFTWDSSVYHSGSRSLKVTINTAGLHGTWIQDISGITAGKMYEFSYWMKTQNVANADSNGTGAYAALLFKDSSGNTIKEVNGVAAIKGTNVWTYVHFVTTAPTNAVSVTVHPRLWSTTGSVWFDDIRLQELADVAIDGNEWNLPDSVTYNDLAVDHKQIVTVKGTETLYYDFYPDRIDIKVTGSNPGGYYIEDGGYQIKTNGLVNWSTGTIDNLAVLGFDDGVERTGVYAYIQQFVSPYVIKYYFGGALKSIRFINGHRTRGYYQRFQVNSGETYSMYFEKANYLLNQGVESGSGSPSNWSTWTNGTGSFTWDSSIYHWGTKSLKINNGSGDASCWYQVVSNPSLEYEFEAIGWAKTSSVAGGNGAFISITAKDSNNNILSEVWSPVLTGTSDWKLLKVKSKLPPGTVSVVVEGRLWGSTGTAWFDDFSLYYADNAAINPGSESGTSLPNSWSTWTSSGTPFTWDFTVYKTGLRSLKISQTTGQTSCWYQNLYNLQKGKEYEFGGWVKTSGVTGGNGALLALVVKDVNGNIIQENWSTAIAGTQDWTYVSGRIILPPLTESVTIQGDLWGSTGTAWFDDVSLRLVRR